MQASSCDFNVMDGDKLVGKLTVSSNIYNNKTWSYLNFMNGNFTQGLIEADGDNYKMVKETNHKTFGTLINFSLSDFNPSIRYALKSGKHTFYCNIKNYLRGFVPNNRLAYYFPLG